MKKLIITAFYVLLSMCALPVAAQGRIVEFNFAQSSVVYQLNRATGSLFAVIREANGPGVCLHTMDFKSKSNLDSIFLYERNDSDRGRQFYQRLEVNLITDQVNLFTSARNRNSVIPIQKRDCSTVACSDLSRIAPCSS